MSAAHGLLTVGCAAIEMAAAFIVVGLLRNIAAESDVELGDAPLWLIDHPAAIAAMALPAMLVGFYAMIRSKRSPLVLIALESVLLLVPFVAILIAFLGVIGPLYQFEQI